jgi:DNA-binding transcriptional MerR regulator
MNQGIPRHFRTVEVARMLGVTKRTLNRWIASGRIPAPERHPENGYHLWTSNDLQAVRNVQAESLGR